MCLPFPSLPLFSRLILPQLRHTTNIFTLLWVEHFVGSPKVLIFSASGCMTLFEIGVFIEVIKLKGDP